MSGVDRVPTHPGGSNVDLALLGISSEAYSFLSHLFFFFFFFLPFSPPLSFFLFIFVFLPLSLFLEEVLTYLFIVRYGT